MKENMFLVKVFSVLMTFCHIYVNAEDPIVALPYGQIRGRIAITESDSVTFYAFQEVPYAAPPVGNLRFQPPQAVPSWEGVLDTQSNTKMCYQVTTDNHYENEDCLYLNVYSPVPPGTNAALPVLVNIYGGTFTHGSALFQYAGPQSFMSRGVVMVTFNYRVGPFGFLSTGDTIVPGNMGLKDQQYALQWVQDNIHLFGGDSSQVTIMGQSAGAASVTFQLLSPGSAGLFRAAIAESGSALCPWAHQRHGLDSVRNVALFIDQDLFNKTITIEEIIQFLVNANASDIDAASVRYNVWAPVVEPDNEGAFITDSMYEMVKNGNINKVPLLIGINSEEYISKAADLDSFKTQMANSEKNVQKLISENMNIEDDDTKTAAGEAVRKIYTDGLFQDDLADAIRYLSDNTFNKGVIRYAEFQSQYTDVYFYQFSYHGILGRNNVSMDGLGKVEHGEDSRYLWTAALNLNSYPESDQLTANRYMKLFINFAQTLNPTPDADELFESIIWPTVSSSNFTYLDIDEDLKIKVNPREFSYQKWVEVYEKYGVQPFYTF